MAAFKCKLAKYLLTFCDYYQQSVKLNFTFFIPSTTDMMLNWGGECVLYPGKMIVPLVKNAHCHLMS